MNFKRIRMIFLAAMLVFLTACSPNTGKVSSGTKLESSQSQSISDNSTISSLNSSISSASSKNSSSVSSSKAPYVNYGHDGNTPTEYPIYSGERDPWLWPFSRDSIWNMPIGSKAVYVNANLSPAYGSIGVDYERHIKLKATDPIQNIYSPSAWNNRWPGTYTGRTMPVPDDLIIPDARGNYTPNECCAFLMPDGRTIKQLEPACRAEYGKQIVGYAWKDIDIYSQGIGGTHWGSGLSAIGGSIRKGELTSNESIKHALKINVWGKKYLYYGSEVQGFRWPASCSDGYAAGNYGGSNKSLVMGSLLALPRGLTPESLGIETVPAKKIFYALQDYGAYISDDSAWDSYDIPAELGVTDEVSAKYGVDMTGNSGDYFNDINKIVQKLCIIKNNFPASIGGGGTPCRPLAPNLPKIK